LIETWQRRIAREEGNHIHEVLLQLVAMGVLERYEEPDEQFLWPGR
jgi:hypothetical protein